MTKHDIPAVVFFRAGECTVEFQKWLLEQGISPAGTIPHLAKDKYAKPFWWAVREYPHLPFMLPVWTYEESMRQWVNTMGSFLGNGYPPNVRVYNNKLDEISTRKRPKVSQIQTYEWGRSMYDWFDAEGVPEKQILVTVPYPGPGAGPVSNWLRPRVAGWRLTDLENAKAAGYTPEMFGVEETWGYLIDADFETVVDGMAAEIELIRKAKSIGTRLAAVGASVFLLNDIGEDVNGRLFSRGADGKYNGFTPLGEALFGGLKGVRDANNA